LLLAELLHLSTLTLEGAGPRESGSTFRFASLALRLSAGITAVFDFFAISGSSRQEMAINQTQGYPIGNSRALGLSISCSVTLRKWR
jgi:hypothetical protein